MRRALFFILCLALLLAPTLPAAADDTIPVYYTGADGAVRLALSLTGNPDLFTFVTDPNQADVIILNGPAPAADAEAIAARVRAGAGLLVILGPEIDLARLLQLESGGLEHKRLQAPLSLTPASGAADPILAEVAWTSAPQVRDRVVLSGFGLVPLVVGHEDGSVVLGSAHVGAGQVFVLTAFLDESNSQFQGWGYFNYLIYHLTVRAAGRTPLSYADYPGSPVPQAPQRALILGLLVLFLATTLSAFALVRRYSLRHPEALDELVRDRSSFEHREQSTYWESIGFHRPLAGFLVALMIGLLVFVPVIIYQNLILPVYLLKSAQALGLWGRVTQFFALAWQLFDLGTSVAFVKFMSQHRVRDPRRAIQYAQLFVWWQAITGAIQVMLIVGVASTLAPRSAYALYAWSIIIHALIQVPGIYQVFRYALIGLQRTDYAQILELSLNIFVPMAIQPLFVLAMYQWGRAHPVFGGPLGGVLGLGLAAYAAELITFLLGLWLFRRIGYNARVLFMAHFDWGIVRTAFGFGVFEMLGSLAWAAGQAAEIWITQSRLVNYAEVWGNWMVAYNFVLAFNVLQSLYNGAMPAISEAVSHGRLHLSQYYAAQSYKYGGLISAFIAAVLLALADRFILGASGPEYVRAAGFAIPLVIWGAIQYPAWVADNVQLAANRPYLKALLILGEQVIRISLAWLLLARFQVAALIIAYFVGLLVKDVVAYLVNHRACFPQRFYVWQSLVAPLLAGTVHYALLRWITGFLWQGDPYTSVLILLVGILLSFPVFAFLYGAFGGWDDDTLGEFKIAAGLTGVVRPLATLVWAATALGARSSPLHGRFPIRIRDLALAEASSLARERVQL